MNTNDPDKLAEHHPWFKQQGSLTDSNPNSITLDMLSKSSKEWIKKFTRVTYCWLGDEYRRFEVLGGVIIRWEVMLRRHELN